MSDVTRRDFIKITGAGVGVAALGTGLATNFWGFDADAVTDPQTDGDRVVPTFCEMCFWKCGVLAHVKDGQVTKIEGNPEHPLSRGRLCPRGTGGIGLLYDPDRLKKPLLRTQERGRQVFKEVSWDAALNHVAARLEAIKAKHGPEAVALYSHGYGGTWFKHLMRAFGSETIAAPGEAQCRAAREAGFHLTIGMPVGSPEITDMEEARVITLIGSHLGENMHNTQVQDLTRALAKGASLIVVDPRFSTAAGKARHWLPIKPGTDIALLLAWMHVIIEEKLYDAEYLETYAEGFEELKRHVADKTPEWAFAHTSLPPGQIRETARLMAAARPASLVHPGRRTAWYGDDTQRSRAIAILNALLGAFGRRGGFFFPASTGLPRYPFPPYEHKPRTPADTPKGKVFPFAESVLAHGVRDASFPGTAKYDIKAWLVYGSNLIQALPQPKRTVEAIKHLDLIVAIDVLPVEITGWADVVLPECTYLERHDEIHNPGYKEPYMALRQPVVPPMGDSKPGWWIAKQLANRLKLGRYFPFEDAEDYLARRFRGTGLSLAQLKKTGVIRGKPQPVYIEQGLVPPFATPSKKIELYSKELHEAGLPALPDFVSPDEPNLAQGELRLLFGRSPVHTFGRTTNNWFLSQVMAKNVVWINKRVAREKGLTCGDWVVLINQDGVRSEPVQVKATQRIRADSVYMVHGYGHSSKHLSLARGRGASDTNLITRVAVDPAMGGTGMNVNFVRVEKIDPPADSEGAPGRRRA
jgi:thiosulfate reductase/polysulfide reductase chain A